jgi:hypothetical protein
MLFKESIELRTGLHGLDQPLPEVNHRLHKHHRNLVEQDSQNLSSGHTSGDRGVSPYGDFMS